MTKEKLIEIIKDLLKTDNDLSFLLQLREAELKKLVACVSGKGLISLDSNAPLFCAHSFACDWPNSP
jgi:hypothetical protein